MQFLCVCVSSPPEPPAIMSPSQEKDGKQNEKGTKHPTLDVYRFSSKYTSAA